MFNPSDDNGELPKMPPLLPEVAVSDNAPPANCAFHYFRPSGKWYTSGRGRVESDIFAVVGPHGKAKKILEAHAQKWPGLNAGRINLGFDVVIIPDDELGCAFPLMLRLQG